VIGETEGQADVLAVTSFRDCVTIDPTAGTSSNPGIGAVFNCTPAVNGTASPPVTTMDLRITPNLAGTTTFDVNLTVVLNNQGGTGTTQEGPSSSVACTPTSPGSQFCLSTTPAKITITSSKMMYRYGLQEISDVTLPYCYASMASFSDFALDVDKDSTNLDEVGDVPCHTNPALTSLCSFSTESGAYPHWTDGSYLCGNAVQTFLGNLLKHPSSVEQNPQSLIQRTQVAFRTTMGVAHMYSNNDNSISNIPCYQTEKSVTGSGFASCTSPVIMYKYPYADELALLVERGEVDPFATLTSGLLVYTSEVMSAEYQGNLCAAMDYNDNSDPFYAPRACVIPTTLTYVEEDPSVSPAALVNQPPWALLSDARSLDVRIPGFRSMPLPFGYTADPIGSVLTRGAYVLPGHESRPNEIDIKPWFTTNVSRSSSATNALNTGSTTFAIVGCSAPSCPANQDTRKQACNPPVGDSVFVYRNCSAYETQGFPASFVNSENVLVTLPPFCKAYSVNNIPDVIVELNIDVSVFNSSGSEVFKETVTLSNMAAGASGAWATQQVGGRLEKIETPSDILGPAIQGAIVICGRESADPPDWIDMRDLIPLAEGQTVDDIPLSENPWKYVMENSRAAGGQFNRTFWFPHPYDYIEPGVDGRGKPAGTTGLDGDQGMSTWFFVPQDVITSEWGSDCNQVGMASSWATSSNNQQRMCNTDPHGCTPGVGKFENGGLKTSVPCQVTGHFALASGMYPATFDVVDKTTKEKEFEISSGEFGIFFRTPSEELNKAMSFMPNNAFVDPTGGTNFVSLYDPENPNIWIGGPGRNLYVDPSTASGIDVSIDIAAEMVLDFVGTFVKYEDSVAPGNIIFQNVTFSCSVQRGDLGELELVVFNPCTDPTCPSGVYILQVDCDEESTGILVQPASRNVVPPVLPGQISTTQVFSLSQNGAAGAAVNPCTATLLSGTDVAFNPILDVQQFDCTTVPPAPNPFNHTTQADGTAPPSTLISLNCTGFCNLKCYVEAGTPWKSGCFIIIVLVLFLAPVLLTIGFIMFFVYWSKNTNQISSQIRSTRALEEEETRKAQEILTSDPQVAERLSKDPQIEAAVASLKQTNMGT
jgi:hypothetical protein